MIYQALLWTVLFYVRAQSPPLDSRVDYGGKWASNILVRVLLLYSRSRRCLYSSRQLALAEPKNRNVICFLNSFIYTNVPLEIVTQRYNQNLGTIYNSFKFLLIDHNRQKAYLFFF